ncbi:neutral zinc metallopeptidase [Patescibacteria group bacterium]|nr:neutral zinc metallopeptidase [Patescibacteria group bacterium]
MALWDKLGSRGNVDDRRAMGPVGAIGGGLGLTGIVIAVLFSYLSGGDVTDVLTQLPALQVQEQTAYNAADFEGTDSYEVFASTVLGSNNDMWAKVFAANNSTYSPPTLVLFRGSTQTGCGLADSSVGPFYCPLDEKIYLDETFFEELQSRFGAQGGDVAEAYVISHEVGHHVQNLTGILDQRQSNEDSIRTELQADCYAGLWAYSIKDLGVFEQNEIIEAIDAAAAVGDDRIQKSVNGRVNPETWTHGSSEQRVQWFNRGYETGTVTNCDTFNS